MEFPETPVRCLILAMFVVALTAGCQDAQKAPAQKAFAIDPQNRSPVNGVWAGNWKADGELGAGKSLVCETIQTGDDTWTATFHAVCDQDYSFTMEMPGRRVGQDILFEVTVDLGENFGGVYHWTGQVAGEQFHGRYTNAKYNGTFQMAKSAETAMNTGVSCEIPVTEKAADAASLTNDGHILDPSGDADSPL